MRSLSDEGMVVELAVCVEGLEEHTVVEYNSFFPRYSLFTGQYITMLVYFAD